MTPTPIYDALILEPLDFTPTRCAAADNCPRPAAFVDQLCRPGHAGARVPVCADHHTAVLRHYESCGGCRAAGIVLRVEEMR